MKGLVHTGDNLWITDDKSLRPLFPLGSKQRNWFFLSEINKRRINLLLFKTFGYSSFAGIWVKEIAVFTVCKSLNLYNTTHNHSFIITRRNRGFFLNNTAFRLTILKQLKQNWKQKLNSSRCKRSKWDRNLLNNQIITAFHVLFFVVIFDDERIIINGLRFKEWNPSLA